MEWRDVRGYEGRYQVSDDGDVRSLLTNRVLKPAPTSKGYSSVVLYDGSSPKQPKSYTVHTLVCAAFIGPRISGLTVNHVDGNKTNNAVSNLELVTMSENMRHAIATGLNSPPDARRINGKLSNKNVRLIRRVYSRTVRRGTQAKLARRFGVTPKVIADVVHGVSYREIK